MTIETAGMRGSLVDAAGARANGAAHDDGAPWVPQPQTIEETGLDFSMILDLVVKAIYFAGRPGRAPGRRAAGAAVPGHRRSAGVPQARAAGRGRRQRGHGRAALPVLTLEQGAREGRGGARAQPLHRPGAGAVRGVPAGAEAAVDPRDARHAAGRRYARCRTSCWTTPSARRWARPSTPAARCCSTAAPATARARSPSAIGHMLPGEVLIPYAIDINGIIVKVFDPRVHQEIPHRAAGAPRATADTRERRRAPARPALGRRAAADDHRRRRADAEGAGAALLAAVAVLHRATAVEGEQRHPHRRRLRPPDDLDEGAAEPLDRADGGAHRPPLAAHRRHGRGAVRRAADLLDEPAPLAAGRRGVLPPHPPQDRDPRPDARAVPGDPVARLPAARDAVRPGRRRCTSSTRTTTGWAAASRAATRATSSSSWSTSASTTARRRRSRAATWTRRRTPTSSRCRTPPARRSRSSSSAASPRRSVG